MHHPLTEEPPIKDTLYMETQHKIKLYIKDKIFIAPSNDFPILLVYFQPLRRGHLLIEDKYYWFQGVLYIEVPLHCILKSLCAVHVANVVH